MNTSEANSYYIKAFKKLLIEEGNGDLFPQNLAEQYPHILDKIFLLWVDPASVQIYFSNLLMNNRSSRAGFPPEVYSELFMLESFYAVKHPQIMPRQELWGGVSKRN